MESTSVHELESENATRHKGIFSRTRNIQVHTCRQQHPLRRPGMQSRSCMACRSSVLSLIRSSSLLHTCNPQQEPPLPRRTFRQDSGSPQEQRCLAHRTNLHQPCTPQPLQCHRRRTFPTGTILQSALMLPQDSNCRQVLGTGQVDQIRHRRTSLVGTASCLRCPLGRTPLAELCTRSCRHSRPCKFCPQDTARHPQWSFL